MAMAVYDLFTRIYLLLGDSYIFFPNKLLKKTKQNDISLDSPLEYHRGKWQEDTMRFSTAHRLLMISSFSFYFKKTFSPFLPLIQPCALLSNSLTVTSLAL